MTSCHSKYIIPSEKYKVTKFVEIATHPFLISYIILKRIGKFIDTSIKSKTNKKTLATSTIL